MSEDMGLGAWVDAVMWLLGREPCAFARVGQVAVRTKDVTSVYLSEDHVCITADALHRVPVGDLAGLLEAHATAMAEMAKREEEYRQSNEAWHIERTRKNNAKWALALVDRDAYSTHDVMARDLVSKLERIAETGE